MNFWGRAFGRIDFVQEGRPDQISTREKKTGEPQKLSRKSAKQTDETGNVKKSGGKARFHERDLRGDLKRHMSRGGEGENPKAMSPND